MRRPGASRALTIGWTLLAAAALGALAHAPPVRRAAARLSVDRASAPIDRRNRLLATLRRAELLHPSPPAPSVEPSAGGGAPCREPVVGLRPIASGSEPSAPGLARYSDRVPGATVVSVWVEPCRFERLLAEPETAAGRREERGWASFRSPEGPDWHSVVGVRLHGGPDDRGRWQRGYRLHFRPRYRANGFPGGRLDPALEGRELDRLIVRADVLTDYRRVLWWFLQPTAFEIGRRLGGVTPATRPVALVLNDSFVGYYVLTEPVNRDLLARRFGHDRFDLVRAKVPRDPPEQTLWELERDWLARQPEPLDPVRVRERWDVDQLTRWLVTDLFCATGDSFQPWLARDRDGEIAAGRWFPVHWDMDVSFLRFLNNPTWRRMQDPLRQLTEPPRETPHPLLVEEVARRLIAGSEAYRRELGLAVAAALNHDLAPARLATLHARLVAQAEQLGIEHRGFLDGFAEFFERRPGELLAQLDGLLGLGPPVDVRVDGPQGDLRVDGRSVDLPYRGRYPARLPVVVSVEPAAWARFLGWTVDGIARTGSEPRLEAPAATARTILARFAPRPSASTRPSADDR